MQARYYDPVIGRFYSNDPVGTTEHLGTSNGIHGFNRYTYANNNPYKYTDPTGMSSYGAQQMSVTMAPNKKAAKAIHSSYTAPRSGSDTTKIVAGAALTMTGNLVPGVITMGEGLTGESLVEQGALAAGFTSEQATYTSIGSDLIGGLTGMLKGIGKIISNFGPETVSGMSKGGIEAVSESAVLVNEGDQVPEKLQKIREDKNEN